MNGEIWTVSSGSLGVVFATTISGMQQADNLRDQVNEWIAQKHGSFQVGHGVGEYSVLSFVGSRSDDVLRLTVWLHEPTHIAEFATKFCS